MNALSLNLSLLFDSLVIVPLIRYWRLWQFRYGKRKRKWKLKIYVHAITGKVNEPPQEITGMELKDGLIDPKIEVWTRVTSSEVRKVSMQRQA